MRRGFHGGLSLLFITLLALAAGAEPRFEVSLDQTTVRVGESATLTMTFTDCNPGAPNVPQIPGLQFSGGGSFTQYSNDNGQTSVQASYTVEVQPTHAGDFVIPAMTVDAGGTRLTSRALTLKAVQGNAPQNNSGPETAMVRVAPGVTRMYLGQVIPIEIQCYFLNNVDRPQMPQFNGNNFIIGALPTNPDRSRSQQGNNLYNCFNFRTTATATRAGVQSLGPVNWSMNEWYGQRDIFGRLSRTRPLTVTSDPVQITVLPIPTNGAPASFHGAIGKFALAQYDAGPVSVNVGDPITLKIRIAGTGSFDTVALPASEQEWREFKTYPATSKFEPSDAMQMQGSKYFEQVITPLNAEVKQLPAFAFSFFDPATAAFHTLNHAPVPLSVHAIAATPQPTVIASSASAPESQQENQDIVHIKPLAGAVAMAAPPLVRQPWFLALQILPPLAWVCALFWRRQKEKLANSPRLRRHRDVARKVREGLAQLPAQAAANDAAQFHATILRLLQEQLGERLDLPGPAITEAVLDDIKGLDAGALALLRELFRACDQYRYTPEHTSQALASLIPKVKTALDALQKMPGAGEGAGRAVLQGAGVALLLLAGANAARAQAVGDLFLQSNKLYEEGKYSQSAAGYEQLLRTGQVSPAIYFNAGNAWFKAGEIGRAIYDYRRAEQLAPRDPDIRANLGIARAKAGATAASLPGGKWTRWVARLTLNEWALAASCAAALFFLVLAARQFSPAFGKSSAGLPGLLAAAAVWLLICLSLSVNQRLLEKTAICTQTEAVARRGPMEVSQSAFTAHDGQEMSVLGRDGDWLQVSDALHQIGWLPAKDVAQIP
ncbi:MAG TPA: BatD family protein [Verrucomicrobiae bacterium]